MRFKNRNTENVQMVETLCLMLSLGAIFFQIWVLMWAVESYLAGRTTYLGSALMLSGLALACCLLTAWTTTLEPFKRKKTGKPGARQNDPA